MEEAKLVALAASLKAAAPKGHSGLGAGVDRHRRAVDSDLPANKLYARFVRAGAALTDDEADAAAGAGAVAAAGAVEEEAAAALGRGRRRGAPQSAAAAGPRKRVK
jgi:hypothetical protein